MENSTEKFSREELLVHLYEAQEWITQVSEYDEEDSVDKHIVDMIDAIEQVAQGIESPKEVRVYAVHDDILTKHHIFYSDEEFIAMSEEDGNVWSLEGFQREHNNGDLFISNYTIRFI